MTQPTHQHPERRRRHPWRAVAAWTAAAALITATLSAIGGTASAATGATGTITGQQSGRCVDAQSAGTANGTVVQLYDCNGTGAQQWQVRSDGSVLNPNSGRCLDVTGAGTANGTRVQLYDCNGTGAQHWQVRADGSVLNATSGRCLDANGSANGSYLQIWDCAGSGNQHWTVNGSSGGGGDNAFWSQIHAGWNLGNSFDATPCETCWGNPATTKPMIDLIATKFNYLRIPVTWYPHMTSGAPNYTVDPAFFARLKQVVDWAIADNMYVDVNVHHDGGGGNWLTPSTGAMGTTEPEFTALWRQIATYFNGESDHLLFEAMNEPQDANGGNRYGGGTSDNWGPINTLNQDFVNTVRATGGANATRWLIVVPYGANAQTGADNLAVPAGANIAVSVHTYNPWAFCSTTAPNYVTWDGSMNYLPDGDVDNANRLFTSRGIPVIWTEYGATVKPYNGGDNSAQVANFESHITSYAAQHGQKTVVWDNGSIGVGDDQFGLMNRNSVQWQHSNIVNAIQAAAG
ncbi:glycoside hydrolase family 5 [Catenulispora acidiphila DSM 44928]|uniref:Glycoside hydrolase family 5 n=1 Tax=Catenulispora acidiphila (strain DSM 44928 / JCM 14897 / NBRC 102108 / NRRL B-24433 / ID139908) TaxID=479433 RepID=C7Q3D0_CATAD|nr:cellulase family glycosylhydrolase [Catenulispora acidiphila]ACU73866.1 glycoside hydrolase family 5 [Catenulispora acidiphila DSM 44928]